MDLDLVVFLVKKQRKCLATLGENKISSFPSLACCWAYHGGKAEIGPPVILYSWASRDGKAEIEPACNPLPLSSTANNFLKDQNIILVKEKQKTAMPVELLHDKDVLVILSNGFGKSIFICGFGTCETICWGTKLTLVLSRHCMERTLARQIKLLNWSPLEVFLQFCYSVQQCKHKIRQDKWGATF